jgi:hypothetical protein
MVSFTTALLALAAAAGVIGAPAEVPAESTISKRSSPNAQGTNNGFFYQFCMQPPAISQEASTYNNTGTDGGGGSATYTNKAAGEYSVTWSSISDMTSGKGWKNALPRNITFKGNVNAQGNFYLAVYTWSQKGENYVSQLYAIYGNMVSSLYRFSRTMAATTPAARAQRLLRSTATVAVIRSVPSIGATTTSRTGLSDRTSDPVGLLRLRITTTLMLLMG